MGVKQFHGADPSSAALVRCAREKGLLWVFVRRLRVYSLETSVSVYDN